MPKTKKQTIFFTVITAWLMVYGMTVYNTVLATGTFTNTTFCIALKRMWVEYIIIGLLAYFVSGRLAKKSAFRIVNTNDRPIFIILSIQVFTVIWQVAFASIIGLYHSYGFTHQIVPNYIAVYCRNFLIALPLQILFVGPIARLVFRYSCSLKKRLSE